MLPRIQTSDDTIGFYWCSPEGQPMTLADVITLPGAEADRWLPTHLEALDDVLIEVAGRYGEILGARRGPAPVSTTTLRWHTDRSIGSATSTPTHTSTPGCPTTHVRARSWAPPR